MATLIITPLISADTCAGAIGWARGSHAWRGITPAFVPNPMIAASGDDSLDAGPLGERRRIADRALVGEQEQADPHAGAAEVGDRDVHEDRAAGSLVGVADEDDRRRYERHQLPEEEERERVTRAENTGEGEHERRGEEAGRAAAARRLQVRGGEDERREGDEAERAEKEPGEPVDAELGCQRARERGAPGAAGGERPEARRPRGAGAPAAWRRSPAANRPRSAERRRPRAIAARPDPRTTITRRRAPRAATAARRVTGR